MREANGAPGCRTLRTTRCPNRLRTIADRRLSGKKKGRSALRRRCPVPGCRRRLANSGWLRPRRFRPVRHPAAVSRNGHCPRRRYPSGRRASSGHCPRRRPSRRRGPCGKKRRCPPRRASRSADGPRFRSLARPRFAVRSRSLPRRCLPGVRRPSAAAWAQPRRPTPAAVLRSSAVRPREGSASRRWLGRPARRRRPIIPPGSSPLRHLLPCRRRASAANLPARRRRGPSSGRLTAVPGRWARESPRPSTAARSRSPRPGPPGRSAANPACVLRCSPSPSCWSRPRSWSGWSSCCSCL